MVRQIHELVLLHGTEEVDKQAFLQVVDLEDPDSAADLLNRHLIGAALRAGGTPSDLHEYVLEVYEPASGGRRGDLLLRWALPYGIQEVGQ